MELRNRKHKIVSTAETATSCPELPPCMGERGQILSSNPTSAAAESQNGGGAHIDQDKS